MGRSMLSKSLIQISVDGRACVPSLLFDLRPNYGGHNEDDGDLLQKVPCKQCSRPPQVHAPTRDSWTLTGKSGSISCEVTAPFSHVWYTQGFVCALQESVSPVLCKFWLLHGGVNGDLLQEGLCRPRSAGPRNGMGITEAGDIKKRWQEYTEELYKKDLQDSDTMMV